MSLDTMVLRTGSYTHDVGVWDSSIVQGPFSVRAVPNPNVTIRNMFIAVCGSSTRSKPNPKRTQWLPTH
jgi:hypothetical protein